MKRSLFFALMLCGLLTVSCGNDATNNGNSNNNYYGPSEPANPGVEGGGEGTEGEGGEGQGSEGEGGEGSETTETLTLEFNFNEFVFEGDTKEYSNVSKGNNKISEVIKTFNSSIEDPSITGVDIPDEEDGYVALKSIEFERTNIPNLNTLEIASQKQSGFIDISFDRSIISCKITAQPYYKCYMNTWSLDTPTLVYNADATDEDLAKLVVNDEDWTMSGCSHDDNWMILEAPQIQTKEFEINSNTISLGADAENRMYVHKIELTFDMTQFVYE